MLYKRLYILYFDFFSIEFLLFIIKISSHKLSILISLCILLPQSLILPGALNVTIINPFPPGVPIWHHLAKFLILI